MEPVAELEATRAGPGGISVNAAFRLTSRHETGAVELAEGIAITPPVELSITAGESAASAILTPKAPLEPGRAYRVTLRTPDDTSAGSWVFQTSRPPRIASTLPGNETTEVPLDTGIEITFDQDGVGDIAPYFSLLPAVEGRFERHGRTAVFIPDQLEPNTVYSATLKRGVPLDGSDLVLEDDFTFAFETASLAADAPTPEPFAWFDRAGVEAGTTVRPILELSTEESVRRVAIRVYRLPTIADAIDAYLSIRTAPEWAWRSGAGLVPTDVLPEIGRFSLPVQRWPRGTYWAEGSWIELPDLLAPGWYLVAIPRRGPSSQLVLQVTDVAITTVIGSGRMIVWANDLATGGPLGGATVETADGTSVGRTDADGLMLTPTPDRLASTDPDTDPRAHILEIRASDAGLDGQAVPGRAAFVSVGAGRAEIPYESRYWRILYTDRSLFRPTDTIEAWGLLRPRDGGAVPVAELRLTAGYEWYVEGEDVSEPVLRALVTPDPQTGVFAEAIPFEALPLGDYTLGLWIDDQRIAATAVQVGTIRKPAYKLEASTDRRVVVDGDTLTATVTASFFDGTRVPGVALSLDGFGSSGERVASRDGVASIPLEVSWRGTGMWGQFDWATVTARPVDPEEADISASTEVLAFRSRVLLDGAANVSKGHLVVRGSLHAVDLERLEREQREGFAGELRPAGAPVAASTVTATITEHWSVRTRTGRGYDFIAKKAFDIYDYQDRERSLPSQQVSTDARGRFVIDLPIRFADHRFDVTLTALDADGRETSLGLWTDWPLGQPDPADQRVGLPTLRFDNVEYGSSEAVFSVGDPIRATVTTEEGNPMPSGAGHRYLFFTARPGWLDGRVQDSPAYTGIFSEQDVPAVSIGAAWFDGSHGGVTEVDWGCGTSLPTIDARIDLESRLINVDLETDAARYRPGGRVALDVRTADTEGRPISASVVLRAVDEKLYAAGGALEGDALDGLYWSMPGESGIASVATSHPVPVYRPFLGDTCGPGVFHHEDVATRDDFRDTLLFKRVRTDAHGRATVSFNLSDDLTSWRVSATAIDADLMVGQASLGVPVGLPLFVETTVAPDYLVGERVILRVRAYGDALEEGERVTFTVSAPSLAMAERRVIGTAFSATMVALPELRLGDHQVFITASAGKRTSAATDRLARTLHVVQTRFTQRRTVVGDLANGLPTVSGSGLVTYVFSDAGRGSFIAQLERLAADDGARLDQSLAADIARGLLVAGFDADPSQFSGSKFDPESYVVEEADAYGTTTEGMALFPYAGADLALSARVALIAGDRFDGEVLRRYFDKQRAEDGTTRERRNIALAGIAGLGGPVLPDILVALADPDLTIRERLYLALGAASLGDHATALAIERDLLTQHGESLGSWLRLRVGSSLDDTIEATGLVALVGAMVGDPAAEWAEAYIEENQALDDLSSLQQIGYIEAVLDRMPAEAARIVYTLNGTSRTISIAAGDAFSINLTPAGASAFSARPVQGRVVVAASWDDPIDPTTLTQSPAITLVRTISPSGTVLADQLVNVTLTATFGPQAIEDCYSVIDILPSGLAAFGESGQRLSFCLAPGNDRIRSVSYRARVVTAGSYIWEPAIAQSARAPGLLTTTEPGRLEIR